MEVRVTENHIQKKMEKQKTIHHHNHDTTDDGCESTRIRNVDNICQIQIAECDMYNT